MPWSNRMRRMYRMIQPIQRGENQSAKMAGTVQSELQGMQTGTAEYVSSVIAMVHRNFLGRATRIPPSIRAAVSETEADGQTKQQWMVDYFSGVLYLLNHRISSKNLGSSWTRRVIDYAACPGEICGLPFVREIGESGNATVDFELWDPLTTYSDFDTSPRRVVHEYVTNASTAIANLGKLRRPVPSEISNLSGEAPVTIAEFWIEEQGDPLAETLKVSRAILANGILAGDPWVTPFKHLPAVIVSVNATSSTWQSTQGSLLTAAQTVPYNRGVTYDQMLYHAEPFFAPVEHPWGQHQQFMSEFYEGLIRRLNPQMYYRSTDGSWILSPEQDGPGARNAVSDEHGEKVEYLNTQMASVAQEVESFKQTFKEDIDRLYNPALFGINPPGTSGYEAHGAASHGLATLNETVQGAGTFMTNGFMEIAHQFTDGGYTMSLKGWSEKGYSGKQYFMRDFRAKDFPDQWMMEFEVKADLPENKMAKLEYAAQGVAQHLFSKRSAMSKDLDIDDVQREFDLIDQEATASLDVIKNIRILRDARDEIKKMFLAASKEPDPKERSRAIEEAHVAQAQYEQMELQLLGQAQSAGQMPGAPGTSPGGGGPPEMNPATNPDQQAQQLGLQSSNAGGQGSVGSSGQGGGASRGGA